MAIRNETFETSDGCPIAYTVRRANRPGAPRMVLIHSLALDASVWDGAVARLSDDAEILVYDCRGHGRSGRRATSFTTDLFARDLAEVLNHVGWQASIVAGCSMGGCVAQAFAGLFPARVQALGLIDTTAWYGADGPRQWRERAAAARAKGFAGLVEFQLTRWFSEPFCAAHPELIGAITKVFLANDLDCYAASCILLGDADLRAHVASLRMPVGIVVGEQDYATPLPHSQYLHEAIPGSILTILPGARHLTPIECPEQIAAQLLALARRV